MADLPPAEMVSRNSSVVAGRNALGSVFVTGDVDTVAVTVFVADTRLRAADALLRENPYRGLDAFRETDSALFFGPVRQPWIRLHALQRARRRACFPS